MRYYLIILALLLAFRVSAQLTIGSEGITIPAGASLTFDGLTLTPSTNLVIANNSIQKSSTPIAGNPSINRLYQFGTPLLFSGKAGISYLNAELNGYIESALQLAYAPTASTTLTVATSNTVNAAANYVVSTLDEETLFIVTATALPDLTPTIYARPSIANGITNFSVVVEVAELNNLPTTGSVMVRITKDPKVTLSFPANATVVGNRPVQNSAWGFNESNPAYYILTTSQSIGASDQLSFGLTGTLNPGSTTGSLTLSSIVSPVSFKEAKLTNNTNADKVDYFQ